MKKEISGALAVIAIATLSACATTRKLAGNAEQQCGGLARAEGLRVNQVIKAENVSGSDNVQMRVEDALGRRFDSTCLYTAANGARWLNPLPANAARR
ncbi:MAG: hypothetical protein ABJA83_09195 [Burkholderiaceae bacterium]